MNNNLQNLLSLQELDLALSALNLKLSKSQKRVSVAKEDIAIENKALADFEGELKALYAKRAALKVERESLDEKVVKYKIQHATLKKNDEYQAMQLTIDRAKEEISKVEEAELEVLFAIDEMEAQLESKRQDTKANLAKIDQEIARLQGDASSIEGAIKAAQVNRDIAMKLVDDKFYRVYARLLDNNKKLPLLVKVEDSKCTGCHLKISVSLKHASNDVSKTPVTCEHCQRILYV